MSSTVILERVTSGAMELRRGAFKVILDGKQVRSIARNQAVELTVEPGSHTLQVKEGRYSSHAVAFDVTTDTSIRFRCNGAILWPQYVASLFVPTIGLRLKRM